MKVHPIAFVQGLALACAVSILMTGCGNRQEEARAPAASTMAPTASTGTPPAGTTVGTEIDDSVVTARVKSALLADPDVKSFDIKVETRKGQVQLSGFVDTQARIDNAIALTRKVEGVKGVENGMSLKDGKAIGNSTALRECIWPSGSRSQSRISCREPLRNGRNRDEVTVCGHKTGRNWPGLRPQARVSPDERWRLVLLWHLPGDALIEFVVRCRLGLWVVLVLPGIRHLPQRRATGRHQTRRRCRLAQMREDAAHGQPCHRARAYQLRPGDGGDRAPRQHRSQPAEHSGAHDRRAAHPRGFIAPAGCVIVSADYSQIELRIMAHISRDENLLRAFAAGEDVHRATAAEIFNRGLRDVSLPELPSWSVAARADQAFRWTRTRDVMPGYRFGVRCSSLRRCFEPERSALQGRIQRLTV